MGRHPRQLGNHESLGILSMWASLMWFSYKRQRERERAAELRGEPVGSDRSVALLPENRKKIVDHPLVAWAIENCVVWIAAVSQLMIFGVPNRKSFLKNVLAEFLGNFWRDRIVHLLQHILVHRVYGHVPFFVSDKGQGPHTVKERIVEFIQLNLPISLMLAPLQANGMLLSKAERQPGGWSFARDLRRLNPLALCAKLAFTRTISDVLFWLGHYLIHLKKPYQLIHKYHHEHFNPNVFTNSHFSVLDLVIEAYAPIVTAYLTCKGVGIRMSVLEAYLIIVHLGWLEACSHSGKPMVASNMIGPIAPLYHAVLGDIDRRNVEFHHAHHELLRCNYSITQWFDHLVGTTRFKVDGKTRVVDAAG